MKKLLIVVGLGLMASSLYAACFGPFCWDEKGAYIGGMLKNGNGDTKPTVTKANLVTTTPDNAGQVIYCSTCKQSYVCVSSGTGQGAYVVLVETGAMATPTHCN